MKRTLLAISLCCFSAVAARAATDVWASHVTNSGGWKTSFSIFYLADSGNATVKLSKYDGAGADVGTSKDFAVPAAGWTEIASSELGYNGTAHLTSDSDLLVKMSYQSGDSPSVCEFYLTGETATTWVLPNSLKPWLEYTGIGLMNSGEGQATVTLEAWKNRSKVSEKSVPLSPKEQYVAMSDSVWWGVRYADFDTVVIRSSQAVAAPVAITGNYAGDRHLFFTAQKGKTSSSPTWTEKIFFSLGSAGSRDIWVMDADGANSRALVQWPGSDEWNPKVSHDGAKLAFISNKSGQYQIWIANVDGTNAVRLSTTNPTHWEFAWTPDDQYVYFAEAVTSTAAKTSKIKVDGTGYQVVLSNASNSCDYRIINDLDSVTGRYLMYTEDHCWNPRSTIYKYDLQTDTQTTVLDGSINLCHSAFSFSPDASQVACFIQNAGGGLCNGWDIYVMNADGTNRHPITSTNSSEGYSNLKWSPDGSKIVATYFASNCDDAHNIYAMNSDGTGLQLLYSNDAAKVSWPYWARVKTSSSPADPVDLLLADSKIVEKVDVGGAVDVSRAASLRNGTVEQGYAVWRGKLNDYNGDHPQFPDVDIVLAVSPSGVFYCGANAASDSSLLSVFAFARGCGLKCENMTIGSKHDLYNELNAKSNALFHIVFSEYKRLVQAGVASGGPAADSSFYNSAVPAVYSRLSKTVFTLFSMIYAVDPYTYSVSLANELNWLWCPMPNNGAGSATITRGFTLQYTGAIASSVACMANNDNGENSHVNLNGSAFVSKVDWGFNEKRVFDQYPSTVELGGYKTWSQISPEITLAVLADGLEVLANSCNPDGGQTKNPAPLVFKINPGWN